MQNNVVSINYIFVLALLYLGRTGRVAFDEMGDRMFAEYEVINIQKSSKNGIQVGQYKYDKVSLLLIPYILLLFVYAINQANAALHKGHRDCTKITNENQRYMVMLFIALFFFTYEGVTVKLVETK